MIQQFVSDEDGQTLIEYGLLTALIAIVAIAILVAVGRRSRDTYTTVQNSMITAGS